MVLISAIDKMKTNEANSLKSFLFGISRNVMRRSWRTKRLPKEDNVFLEELPDYHTSVFREVTAREELSLALNAIQQFPDLERQILLLRFVEMFKLKEIAEVMDMPLNSVKSCIHRSRKKLCQILNIPQSYKSEVKNGK